MNVYRVIEDGVDCCITAKTMDKAVKVCEGWYIDEVTDELTPKEEVEDEIRQYHEQILQSCELVGELKTCSNREG